jgi:hypothetical protein
MPNKSDRLIRESTNYCDLPCDLYRNSDPDLSIRNDIFHTQKIDGRENSETVAPEAFKLWKR